MAVPLPVGITRPLDVTEATAGFELTHSTERVWSSHRAVGIPGRGHELGRGTTTDQSGALRQDREPPVRTSGIFRFTSSREACQGHRRNPSQHRRENRRDDRPGKTRAHDQSLRTVRGVTSGGQSGGSQRGSKFQGRQWVPGRPEKGGNWRREIHTLNNIPTVAEFSRKVKQFLVRVADHDRRSCSRYSIRYLSNAKDTPNARES